MRRVWWLWSLLWIWGCGAGIGMIHPVERSDPQPPLLPSLAFHLTGLEPPMVSEFYVRAPVAYPKIVAVGVGFYRSVGMRYWQTPLPLPILGLQLGILKWQADSIRAVIGGHLALALEWTFLRNAKPPRKIGEGEFLWWYLQSRAGVLVLPWRLVSPRIAVELGFRVSQVYSF